ncbi:hypothetical protein H5T87_05410 [bacterium]|nr:hypothetical protein [bacterium]
MPIYLSSPLYPYQFAFLSEKNRFSITLKARQVGFSYAFALRGLYQALNQQNYSALYISLNQRDAEEKLRYARLIYNTQPKDIRQKVRLIRDSQQELAFSNGSRLLSLPCSAGLRGKSGHLYLDEFAHFREDEEIFIASLPLASRGYEVHIASTPLGARGLFYEIWQNKDRFSNFKRIRVPWWHCPEFTNDLLSAYELAEDLTTEERVEKFGTESLKEIFRSFPTIEGFQQEYECSFLSDGKAFFTYEELLKTISDELPIALPGNRNGYFHIGIDIGRLRDATCVVVVFQPFSGYSFLSHLEILLKKPFAEQFTRINEYVKNYRPIKVYIDATGMGMPLAEELKRQWGNLVVPVSLTRSLKESLITNLKSLFQREALKIPRNMELFHQLHAIERETYSAKGHDDIAWALALACAGIRDSVRWEVAGGDSFLKSLPI